MRKVIVANNTVTVPSKDFAGKESELAKKIGLVDYAIMDEANVPDFTPESEKIAKKIAQLETIPRRIRERLAALGDEYAIAEEEAIKTERNKLKGKINNGSI